MRATRGILILLVATAIAASAQTFTTLEYFSGNDGSDPKGAMAQGIDGILYGTTYSGGAYSDGTLYRVMQPGSFNVFYYFCPIPGCLDGSGPVGALDLGTDGNLYGTTSKGGAAARGNIFKFTPEGTLTDLYDFCTQPDCPDGSNPVGGLVQDLDGNFYGVSNPMSLYRVSPSGRFTLLFSCDLQRLCPENPSPLTLGIDGNFYGTAEGSESGTNSGSVFRLRRNGTFTILYDFCVQKGSCPDGANPEAALVQGGDGNFYGTTALGGASNLGTIFRITPKGQFTTFYSFSGGDGSHPVAGLIQATDGNFYGTTEAGGTLNMGTIFMITPGGMLTTLYSFCKLQFCDDGAVPTTGLLQRTDGNFYGTTSKGYSGNKLGTLFMLDTGLSPFVAFVRGGARVGARFGILGQGLTGTTNVSVNGVSASFTIRSDTAIESTVPVGATTGFVTVTTPNGTLTSNKQFQVIP